MDNFIHNESDPGPDMMVCQQYMMQVSATAEACGVNDLECPWDALNFTHAFESFLLAASRIVTRFRILNSGQPDTLSVRIASKTRGKIEQQIAKLRDLIADSNLPDNQRKKFMGKLDELSVELSRPGHLWRCSCAVST